MSANPIIGTIRAVAFDFIEVDWLPCDGRLLAITQYSVLFSILGTTYGGDGRTTFALPDLRSRAIAGPNPGGSPGGIQINQGDMPGYESLPLMITEMPIHNHGLSRKNNTNRTDKVSTVSPNASLNFVGGVRSDGTIDAIQSFVATTPPNPPPTLDSMFSPLAIMTAGQGMPHENRQPFLALNYQICVNGEYPMRPS